MMKPSQFKVCQFQMDLNYPMSYHPMAIEEYTNWLVNKRMNDFNQLFCQSGYKFFVLDYKDDLISLICYRMLKNLQSACSFDFDVLIYGKVWDTRQYIQKKQKRISKWKLNQMIQKDECVIVQGSNLLYNVVKSKITYKDFPCPTWCPIWDFTPKQIETLQIFYHIGYLKKDKIQFNNKEVIAFNDFCAGNSLSFDFPEKIEYNKGHIGVLKLTGDKDKDTSLLQSVENYPALLFYFTPCDAYDTILKSEYSLFVEFKANIPDKYNVNNYLIPKEIQESYPSVAIDYLGDWTDEEKERFK